MRQKVSPISVFIVRIELSHYLSMHESMRGIDWRMRRDGALFDIDRGWPGMFMYWHRPWYPLTKRIESIRNGI